MSTPRLPESLWLIIEPLLPPVPPKPKGGRPPVPARAALTGILFVLPTGEHPRHQPDGYELPRACGAGPCCQRRSESASATVYCASVSDTARRKRPSIARRAVHYCAPLQVGRGRVLGHRRADEDHAGKADTCANCAQAASDLLHGHSSCSLIRYDLKATPPGLTHEKFPFLSMIWLGQHFLRTDWGRG